MIHHILGQNAAIKVLGRHLELIDPGFFQLLDMTGRDTTTFFNNQLAFVILDIECRNIATKTARNQLQLASFRSQRELTGVEEHFQHLLGGVTERTQKN